MDEDKAIRAAKLTLGGMLEKRRAEEAKRRAPGQIAPSKYLPNVPRQAHAFGGYVPEANLPVGRLAVAKAPIQGGGQPSALQTLAGLAETVTGLTDTYQELTGKKEPPAAPSPQAQPTETTGGFRPSADNGGMSDAAIAAYAKLVEAYGQPLTIVSGYRDPKRNEDADGAKNSQHLHGNAYDLDTSHLSHEDRLALADLAWNSGFRGFGFYNNNMHFDVGDPRAWGPSYSRDSIPQWALPWAQERYGYADGGTVADLGQAREQKQLKTYHTGMMDDIHQRMSSAMEAHQKAVDAGHFDGYEVGDVLQGSAHPMRITGRYVQKWKPSPTVMRSFDRMGAEPTIIEHEGQQYIPMLRYQTGKEGTDDWQEGSVYLDGVKAAGYQKMGGLRAVKARGGAVEFMKGNHPDVPETLYHGNALRIAKKGWTDEIDAEGTRRNMEAQDFREFKPSEYGNYGPGIYLSDSPKVASNFAQAIRADQKEPQPFGQVMKLHVSMKKPFTDDALRHPGWIDYIKGALTRHALPHEEDRSARDAFLKKLDDGTATVRDMFVRDTPHGTLVNQWGNDAIHDTIRRSGFDGIIAHGPNGTKEYVAFKPEQVKSALSATKFDPTSPDMTYADGGYVPQKTQKAYKLFRKKGDSLLPLFVNADKPVPMGKWLEAEGGPQGKTAGKVKSKLGDLAYRPGWHAGDLPIATHIGGKSKPDLKKPDYRPDDQVWAEVEMAADHDWQSEADSRGKGVKAHITDQVPLKGFYRYKTNPNMTGNWLIGGHMKVNRVLSDDEVKSINDAAGTADLPRLPRGAFADGGAADLPHWSETTMSSEDAAGKLRDASAHPGVDMQLMPLRPGQYSHEGDEHDGPEVWIEWLKRHDDAPKGAAALAMGKLTSAADHTNSVLRLEPDHNDPALVKYYKKFGFEEDPSGGEVMERTPRLSMKRQTFAAGGAAMFEGIHEDLQDEQGKPMDLWHGTPAPKEFEAFDDAKMGGRDAGFFGRGHYLTPERGNAEGYADPDEMGRGTVMGPLHAALKNPYVWDTSSDNASHRTLRDLQAMGLMRDKPKLEPWDIVQQHEMDTFMRHMRDRGHDGVIVKTQSHDERPHRVSEIVVFKPTAIKHKDAEVFDPNDPRIRRADGGKVGLYSKAAQIIRGMKDQKMDVDDILKYAEGKGVKKAEMSHVAFPRGTGAKWKPSDVAEYFDSYQPEVGVERRETFYRYSDPERYERQINYLEGQGRYDEAEELNREYEAFSGFGGKDAPLYARYQLPGGQNYREHILTLDNHQGETYKAPIHWSGTKNPLAHIRMSDRMDGNRKILHIEEMQSDWSNDARRKGFKTGKEQQEYDDYVKQLRQEAIDKVKARTGQNYYDPTTGEVAPTMSPMVAQAQIEKYQKMDPYMLAMKMGKQSEHHEKFLATKSGVPQAPYVDPKRDDWAELAMKHVLTEAAKGGYDGIAFTPDEAQSERWNGTNFNGIYNKKLPGIADRLIRQHDPDQGTTSATRIGDYVAPMVELSPEARDSIQKNSFPSFRRGGYVVHERRAR